jgi:hypothetical protein
MLHYKDIANFVRLCVCVTYINTAAIAENVIKQQSVQNDSSSPNFAVSQNRQNIS